MEKGSAFAGALAEGPGVFEVVGGGEGCAEGEVRGGKFALAPEASAFGPARPEGECGDDDEDRLIGHDADDAHGAGGGEADGDGDLGGAGVAHSAPEEGLEEASAVHGVGGDEDVEREEDDVDVVGVPKCGGEPEGGSAALGGGLDRGNDVEGCEGVEEDDGGHARKPEGGGGEGEDGGVDERPAGGGGEMGAPAVGRAAEGEASDGEHDDAVGGAADGAAGEAMAELVEEDKEEEGAHGDGHEADAGVLPRDGPEEFDGDEEDGEEVDAYGDAGGGENSEGPAEGIFRVFEDSGEVAGGSASAAGDS